MWINFTTNLGHGPPGAHTPPPLLGGLPGVGVVRVTDGHRAHLGGGGGRGGRG